MQIGTNNPQPPVKFAPAPPPQSRTGHLPHGPHSPVKQQAIVNTIMQKGVVQTGQLPKLSFLQKLVAPLHSRPKTEAPEREEEAEEPQETQHSSKKTKEKETVHKTAPSVLRNLSS